MKSQEKCNRPKVPFFKAALSQTVCDTAIRYFYNRMKTFKLSPDNVQKENYILQQILINNKYDASTLNKINKKRKEKQHTQRLKWQNSHMLEKRRSLSLSCLRTPMLRWRSLPITE
jgi:hypothetical protein